jgi:hypothetical protein
MLHGMSPNGIGLANAALAAVVDFHERLFAFTVSDPVIAGG